MQQDAFREESRSAVIEAGMPSWIPLELGMIRMKNVRDQIISRAEALTERRAEVRDRRSEDGKGGKVRRSEKQKIGRFPVKSPFGGLPMAAFNGASGGG